MVSQITAGQAPVRVAGLSLPDEPVITGKSKEIFDHYGLNAEGIARAAIKILA